MPRKSSSKPVSARDIEPEGGPRSWLVPRLEAAHSAMRPREEADRLEAGLAARERRVVKAASQAKGKPKPRRRAPVGALVSRLQPGRADDVLAEPSRDFWRRPKLTARSPSCIPARREPRNIGSRSAGRR